MSKYEYEVVLHDPVAQALAPFFLPPSGSHVTVEEMKAACQRLADATVKLKHANAGRPQ